MSTYTIGETAELSGFTASSLRYYEGIGLVSPSARTGAGYRVYDDHTLARLAFIARAKQLGCTLEEITDLVGIWDGESCGPVQRRFHDLVTDKIAEAQRQARDLTALIEQLRVAAALLAGPASDGPCDDSCACASEIAAGFEPVALVAKPAAPPIACTLEGADVPDRLADWRRLLDRAHTRSEGPGGALRIAFGTDVPLEELARLIAAEHECCAFFSFAITVDHTGIGLDVEVPDGAEPVVESLFGAPA